MNLLVSSNTIIMLNEFFNRTMDKMNVANSALDSQAIANWNNCAIEVRKLMHQINTVTVPVQQRKELIQRYYIISETDDGEDSSTMVDAADVITAINLYTELSEKEDWVLGSIKHIWELPVLKDKPGIVTWSFDIKLVYG